MPSLSNSIHRIGAVVWLLLAIAVVYGLSRLPSNWLETDLFALLPKAEYEPVVKKAIDQFNNSLNQRLVWLIGAENPDEAAIQAKVLEKLLEQSELFADAPPEWHRENFTKRYEQLFPYRYLLLSTQDRDLLTQDPDTFIQKSLAVLHNPLGQIRFGNLERDPLFLFGNYLTEYAYEGMQIRRGIAVVNDNGQHWALLVTRLRLKAFSLDYQQQLLNLVEKAKQQQTTSTQLLVSGLPLFTAHGSARAKGEISIVGLGSATGVLVLLLLTFRSARPLLLAVLAIGFGMSAGFLVGIWWFGKVHILTLVFGSSLIGVSIDYALHYFSDSFRDHSWLPVSGLKHVFPGITLGLITSCLGYLSLSTSPFPGLQQVALFSAVGLTGAWITVVLLFPMLLYRFQPTHQPSLLQLAELWQQRWPNWIKRKSWLILLATTAFTVGGLLRLTPQDDIRQLQSVPAELLETDRKIRNLLPQARDSQFFLIEGNDLQTWWQNEQELLKALDRLKIDGSLSGYEALSDFWPSPQKQAENLLLIETQLIAPERLQRYMEKLGFRSEAIKAELNSFVYANTATNYIEIEQWLTSAHEGLRSLWLGCEPIGCRSLVALKGIKSLQPLVSLATNNIDLTFVNYVSKLSAMMGRYRQWASSLLGGVFTIVLILLLTVLGWRRALTVVFVPSSAVLIALAGLGWLNSYFSLFNLFALLLVLGIGIDYAVFFLLSGESRSTTALAVMLAATTTLLSFGLLVFSSTEVVHAFGLTVLIGISTALLLAPIIGSMDINQNVGEDK